MPSLKKLWKRKSAVITEYDPSYKVIYLGNVVTGWAKGRLTPGEGGGGISDFSFAALKPAFVPGDGCIEKPLATLWRNYCQNSKPDISMKVSPGGGRLCQRKAMVGFGV